MQAHYLKYLLNFKQPSGTSRGILTQKETFFLILEHDGYRGIGECALFRGLSADDVPEYEAQLQWVCRNIQLGKAALIEQLGNFPSLVFGIEQAFLTLEHPSEFLHFPSKFTAGKDGIPINGLIWMGKPEFMKEQIRQKIDSGFTTLKLKIGALDFQTELDIIQFIRKEFKENDLTIRVDANGAFYPDEALEKLKRLSEFQLHSIEQPIKAGQWESMASLCASSPIPIALDEELIGIFEPNEKKKLLNSIRPPFIILKPSLHGGIVGCNDWINLAETQKTGWWITSALESNVGLNAIAQYTYTCASTLPQGLGTGGLYTNNIESPLEVSGGYLRYDASKNWDLSPLFQNHSI